MTLGQPDFVTVIKSRRSVDLVAVDGGAILRGDVVDLNGEIAVDDDRAMPARNGCIVDDDVIVRQAANAIKSHFEGDLSTTIKKPAMSSGLLYGNFARGKCFKVFGFGAERHSNFPGDRMSAGGMFHSTASSPKGIAARISFEMDT